MKIGQCSAPPCAGRYFGKACGLMLYLLPKPLILALGELASTYIDHDKNLVKIGVGRLLIFPHSQSRLFVKKNWVLINL
jgi:hypothetical protein